MKPLMYGYMRAPDDEPDDELDRTVHEMQRFAETEGFCYAATSFEYQHGSRAAFDELIQELKRVEARYVVVPTLAHLSSHRMLCTSMVERLELDANAHVFTPKWCVVDRRDLSMSIVRQLRDISKDAGAFVAGVLSEDISQEDQITFALRLVTLAERIKDRADSTAGIIIEGDVPDDGDSGRPALTAGASEPADHPHPAVDD